MTTGCLILLLLVLMASDVWCRRRPKLSDEQKLMKQLMDNNTYINPTGVVRPVTNVSETLKVAYGLSLLFINDIDRRSGIAEFTLWERFAWKDINLRWNPDDFGGIHQLSVPMEKPIWRPDIVLYNSVNVPGPYSEDILGVVSYDGNMLHIPSVVRKVKCDIEQGGLFGNDVASCSFKFGSWTHDGFKLDVDFFDGVEAVDISDYRADRRYEILGHDAQKNTKYYPCCMEPYLDLTFNLEIKML